MGHYYEAFDKQISAGHCYVSLYLSLDHAKDGNQANDIRDKMALLLCESRYLLYVLDAYGPYRLGDALAFLASRSSGNRESQLLRDAPKERTPQEAYRIGKGFLSIPANGGELQTLQEAGKG